MIGLKAYGMPVPTSMRDVKCVLLFQLYHSFGAVKTTGSWEQWRMGQRRCAMVTCMPAILRCTTEKAVGTGQEPETGRSISGAACVFFRVGGIAFASSKNIFRNYAPGQWLEAHRIRRTGCLVLVAVLLMYRLAHV
ncbi:MAG: hypothetical protein R6U20_13730 [Longimonas sp.]|uniref:hypothetical protein n=1 Tax=Longimonas sp. TaxID=2039626 RepID=UPI00397692D0